MIPYKIHHIWLQGGVPEGYQENYDKWDAFLIDWDHKVWDEKALLEALKNGKIEGAAIDVFEKEPYLGPLRECDNTILTPHIGSYAKEARIAMEFEATINLLKGLNILSKLYSSKRL